MNLKKHIDWVINPYALVEDNQRRMWVGTKGYGIYLFDIENYNESAHLTHKKISQSRCAVMLSFIF